MTEAVAQEKEKKMEAIAQEAKELWKDLPDEIITGEHIKENEAAKKKVHAKLNAKAKSRSTILPDNVEDKNKSIVPDKGPIFVIQTS